MRGIPIVGKNLERRRSPRSQPNGEDSVQEFSQPKSPLSAHRSTPSAQDYQSEILDIQPSARLAQHSRALQDALSAVFGKKPATFYEIIAEINTYPKIDGMAELDISLNNPDFTARLFKDIPYLFDAYNRSLIEGSPETLDEDDSILDPLKDVIQKVSEYVFQFKNINSELSNALEKLLAYYQESFEKIRDPEQRAQILELRGFAAGLSLKLTSVDLATLCVAASVTKEGQFNKTNKFGGSAVAQMPVPKTDDSVFLKLGVVRGQEVESLKYDSHCLNAAILEVGPPLEIREKIPMVVEAELLVLGIPVLNSNGEVVDFRTYSPQATLGIKGPEYHYTLGITELTKRLKIKLGSERFKTFYEDCLNYEPLVNKFCTSRSRKNLLALSKTEINFKDGEKIKRTGDLLEKEFNSLAKNKYSSKAVKEIMLAALEFLKLIELIAAFSLIEKYPEVIELFSEDELETLIELVHLYQGAKRYSPLPKIEQLSTLNDRPEIRELASLGALNAYIRRDADGKSDNWINYCCIDPPVANRSRFDKRKQGHYNNIKDVHYLVPSIMHRRFDKPVQNWFASTHPALQMVQWMYVILERSLRLIALFDSQVQKDPDLARIQIPADYIKQELNTRRRIQNISREYKDKALSIQEFLRKVDPIIMRFYELVAEQNKGKSIARIFRDNIYRGETVEQVFRKKYTDEYVVGILEQKNATSEPFLEELKEIVSSTPCGHDEIPIGDKLCQRLFQGVPEYEKNFNEETIDIFTAYKRLVDELDWEQELTDDEQFSIMVALGEALHLIKNQRSFGKPHRQFITQIPKLSQEGLQRLLIRALHVVDPMALSFLLSIGAMITSQDSEGRNALYIFCERHGDNDISDDKVFACMHQLLSNPGVNEAFRHNKNSNSGTPIERLISCSPRANPRRTEKLLELIYRKFPNAFKKSALLELCIQRNKPTLFSLLIKFGARPAESERVAQFIRANDSMPEIKEAKEILMKSENTSAFLLSKIIKEIFSGVERSPVKLMSIEDTSIEIPIKEDMVLNFPSPARRGFRLLTGKGFSIQVLNIPQVDLLHIFFFQDALERAAFGTLEFSRNYLKLLKARGSENFLVCAQAPGIPLNEATEEDLEKISSASFTKLFLLALILDPEADDQTQYSLIPVEGAHDAQYRLIRTGLYTEIGLLSQKTKSSYLSEVFNMPFLMERSLDKDVVEGFISKNDNAVFSSFVSQLRSANFPFSVSENMLSRLSDRIVRLQYAIKQNPFVSADGLLQAVDPEKANEIQDTRMRLSNAKERMAFLRNKNALECVSLRVEAQKPINEHDEYIQNLALDNLAVQENLRSLNADVASGTDDLIRLTQVQACQVLEQTSCSIFKGSPTLEKKLFGFMQKGSFSRVIIRFSQTLGPREIESIIKNNAKILTHLDLSGSAGVTDKIIPTLQNHAENLKTLILNGTEITSINFYMQNLKHLEVRSKNLNSVEMPFCEVETLIISGESIQRFVFYSPYLSRFKVPEFSQDHKSRFSERVIRSIENLLLLSPKLVELELNASVHLFSLLPVLRRNAQNWSVWMPFWSEKDTLMLDGQFSEEQAQELFSYNEKQRSPATTVDIRDFSPRLIPTLLYYLASSRSIKTIHARPYEWLPKENAQGEILKKSLVIGSSPGNQILEILDLPNGNMILIRSHDGPLLMNPNFKIEPLLENSYSFISGAYVPNGLIYLADEKDLYAYNGCGLVAKHTLLLEAEEKITIIRGCSASSGKAAGAEESPSLLVGTSLGRVLFLKFDKMNNPGKLRLLSVDEDALPIKFIIYQDEQCFLSATAGRVKLYNPQNFKPIVSKTIQEFGRASIIASISFFANKFAIGFGEGRVFLFEKKDLTEIFSFAYTGSVAVSDVKVIDPYNLVSSDVEGNIYIWNEVSPATFHRKRQFKVNVDQTGSVFLSAQKNGNIFVFSGDTCTVFYSGSSYISLASLKATSGKAGLSSSRSDEPQHEVVKYNNSTNQVEVKYLRQNPNFKLMLDLMTLTKAQVFKSREPNGVLFEFLSEEIHAAFLNFCLKFSFRISATENKCENVFSFVGLNLYEEAKKQTRPERTSDLSRSSEGASASQSPPPSPRISSAKPLPALPGSRSPLLRRGAIAPKLSRGSLPDVVSSAKRSSSANSSPVSLIRSLGITATDRCMKLSSSQAPKSGAIEVKITGVNTLLL